MFQTYDPVSDRSFASKHTPLLRDKLRAQNLDGFVVPHDDEYQNEYVPEYADRLLWVSGFSGSAGAAVVLIDRAVIFVDGRYTLQVRDQVDDAIFEYEDLMATPVDQWLSTNVKAPACIGYDPMLHSLGGAKALKAAAEKAGFTLVAVEKNPIDEAWADQPAIPQTPIRIHALEHAGKSSEDKRSEIANHLRELEIDAFLVTAPPSIAWAFNIRGQDVARTPLTLGRALLRADGTAELFVSSEKTDQALLNHLGDEVTAREESAVAEALAALGAAGARVGIDPALTPAKYADALQAAGASLVELSDPCALPRAQKNATEQDGARAAHIRDGAAIVNFLHWLATEAQSGEIDEITAAKKLENFRREDDSLADISFDTISAAGPNGAHCHYRVSTETNLPLALGSLYLVDSGGQYRDGTTDITRTVAIGAPTPEMRDRFTRVLKGHIALATTRFPNGVTGHQLDAIARRPLWEAGLDYDHGTGHGVGSFLGVHEGPQRIAKAANSQPLLPGMIISNEPGFYKEGEFGIRIENLIIVTKPEELEGCERPVMGFETITLAPISPALIDVALLNDEELSWLNAYHARVRKTLTPLLYAEVADWLADETKSLSR